MKRRQFIAGLGSAVAWPLAVRAQQPAMPVIGLLSSGSAETSRENIAAFHRGLSEIGYVEGRNVAVEYRWAYGQIDRLPDLVADLVRRKVAVLSSFDGGTTGALAAKAATTTIPVVFVAGADPVAFGLVGSLNRPGGNLTGVALLNVDLSGKRLELLHQLVPTATSIAVLLDPASLPSEAQRRELQLAARVLGVGLLFLNAKVESEFESAFATVVQRQIGALLIAPEPFFNAERDRLVALAARHRIPSIYAARLFAEAGGLMSYGPSRPDAFRIAGVYTGRILKGEKPADLPVQQATKLELVINLKTAKALGLTIPETLRPPL
jgi:putative ABC transport system substrate-binding protein